MKRKYILILLLLGVLVFLYFQYPKEYPEVRSEMTATDIQHMPYADAEVTQLLKIACFDCHSYNVQETPWYGNLPIVKGWMASHMIHGRGDLNFSEWATYDEGKRAHKLEEIADKVKNKEMPLTSYLLGHSAARISEDERKQIADWAMEAKRSYE